MSIPNLQIVLKTIRENYNCSLTTIKGKRIMFEGVSNNKKLVLCTPSSKLHSQGKGWFDLTTKQVELLDNSDISILAVRLEGGKVYCRLSLPMTGGEDFFLAFYDVNDAY
jgi:hypothetical protein